nr:metallophosphoesterase [uncultured Draconibacterium sp.]
MKTTVKQFIFLTLVSLLCLIGHAQNSFNLEFVVEPYLQDVTDSSFTVMWETSLPCKGQLYIATASHHVLRPELQPTVSEKEEKVLHKLSVESLSPEELYFYQIVNVNDGDTLKSSTIRLTLPDYSQSLVSFTVVGDNQGNDQCWERINQLMEEECPSFIVHCGDLVSYGPNKDDWTDEFFKPGKGLLSYTPLYPAIGNHEMNDEKFYQYFNLPYDDAFYTIKKGNLRVIFIDTNKDVMEGSFRYKRLEQTLANCKEQWKIVVHHHPVFTSNIGAYRSSLQATSDKGDPNIPQLKKLYETYGVDIVFSGHVHGYERTFPVRKNHMDEENGVTYIICAGGGGRFNPVSTHKEWFAKELQNRNFFLNMNIVGNKLSLEAIDTSRIVFDSWTKEKTMGEKVLNVPLINSTQKYFIDSTNVFIKNTNDCGIVNYRMNDENYEALFDENTMLKLKNTTTVSALVSSSGSKSREAVKTFIKLSVLKNQKKSERLKAEYYDESFTMIPDFEKLTPQQTFYPDSISNEALTPKDKHHFAMRYTGSFSVHETDVYRFTMESFDGSRLIIDGQEFINNNGVHYEITKQAFVALEKGIHHFEVKYFDFVRRKTLKIKIGSQSEDMENFNNYIDKSTRK